MKIFRDTYPDKHLTFEFKILYENDREQRLILSLDETDLLLERFGRYTGDKINGE